MQGRWWCGAEQDPSEPPEPSGAGTSAGLGGKWDCLGFSSRPVELWAPSRSPQGTPRWTVLGDPGAALSSELPVRVQILKCFISF